MYPWLERVPQFYHAKAVYISQARPEVAIQ